MHNGWAFTKPSKYCKTTFLALSRLAYVIMQLWVKQYYYVGSRNEPLIISELQQNLQKHISYRLLWI